MLVICEDCGKKFNIDETRIKKKKAKFTCNECGHIVVVEKPEAAIPAPDNKPLPVKKDVEFTEGQQQTSIPDSTTVTSKGESAPSKGKGWPIGIYILLTLVTGFLMVCGAFGFLYFKYIPEIVNNQIELRTAAITGSFSGVINKPLLLRNYLQVNKEAKRVSKLPGVAYAAVVNERGIVVAGFFSDLSRFNKSFETRVKEKGVPVDVFLQNKLPPSADRSTARIVVGGQVIYDEVSSIPDSGGEVHVGIYLSDVDRAIRDVLVSPLTFSVLGGILLIGFIVFLLLTKSITRPMQELTDVANRISLGDMNLTVRSRGPREMRNLAIAFERMRRSIKAAMERLSQ